MNGFYNINKPTGMSSAAVVAVMRRLTGEKRVGHAGTLDPEAAGVLPVMTGKATRLFDYLVDKEKEYITVCVFGAATDTQDATGKVTETGSNYPSPDVVRAASGRLVGDIIQKPGMYSAIKMGGKPMYLRARNGEQADVPERRIHVESIEILRELPEHRVEMKIRCGKGTYIRSICEDLGKLCGCPAHMGSLIRTQSGAFRIGEALSLDEARELAAEGRLAERMLAPDWPLGRMLRTEVPEKMAKAVEAGAKLPAERLTGSLPEEGGTTRIYLGGDFWGIAEKRGEWLYWRAQIAPERKENG